MSLILNDLIQTLLETIEEAKPVPLVSDKCMVSKKDVIYILEDIIRCMPKDLEEAKEVVNAREAIINEATKQAETIVEKAKMQAEKLVDRESVTKQAEDRAKFIVQNAQTKSIEIRKDVTEYCYEALLSSEEKLAHILEELKTTRHNFKKGKQ